MNSYVRPIDAILPRAARSFGSKARNLAALARAGFPVPAAYVVSCEAAEKVLEQALPPRLQPATLLAATVPNEADLAQARALVLRAPLPRELQVELRNALLQLRAAGAPSVAVRASSVVEDAHVASAAGLHTSVLNVTSEEGLQDAVRACWAAVMSPRVYGYLHTLGVKDASSVGVVIQAMVPADVAGTLFTVNPLTQDTSELVIHAAYGLGVAVVDGRVSPDTYYIDKRTGFLRDRVVGEKLTRVLAPVTGGVREASVSAELANKEALDEHTRARLVDLGLRVERHFGEAREVEWAVLGDTLYALHARAVAVPDAWQEPKKRGRPQRAATRAREQSTVWSSVGIGDALPGVVTPLTWSVLSSFSDIGFHRAFAGLGCKVPKGASFVGNFRGRIYVNLTELSQVAAQVPGLRPRTVLPLGGGPEIDRLERELPKSVSIGFLSRLPMTATRFLRENVGLRTKLERFEPTFLSECQRIRSLDLRILPSPSLDETLADVERMLDDAGGLMLTAYGRVLASIVPLSAALRVAVGEDAPRLQVALVTAVSNAERTQPRRTYDTLRPEGSEVRAASGPFGEDDQDVLQRLAMPARTAIEGVLLVVRHAVRMRERLRGHLLTVLDVLRDIAMDVSRRIAVREPGIGDDAALYLTLAELHGFLRGELRAVRPLVEMRRAGYERDRTLPAPPTTFVDYPPPVTPRAARARRNG